MGYSKTILNGVALQPRTFVCAGTLVCIFTVVVSALDASLAVGNFGSVLDVVIAALSSSSSAPGDKRGDTWFTCEILPGQLHFLLWHQGRGACTAHPRQMA